MKKVILVNLFWVIFLPLKAQILSDSLLIEGHYRSFHYVQPYANSKLSDLVFILHGSGGNGKEMRARTISASKIEAKATELNTLVVYPDAYKKYWNECRKASPAEANVININEQAFFDAMITTFNKKYGINTKNVFVAGVSGGGHMAYKLAMTMPNKFRAITAFIANLPDSTNMDCVASGKPLPVMIVNGTIDPINPYNGGEVNLGAMKMGAVLSTEKTLHYWANLAQYSGEPTLQKLPDNDPNDGKIIEKYTYKQNNHPEIVLLKVIGGKHELPKDIDPFVEALLFFQRQKI